MNIGVFFGGKSPEHDVSIITGLFIISELKKMPEYKFTPIYMGKDGEWYINEKLGKLKFFREKNSNEQLKKFNKFYIDLEESRGKLVFKKKGLVGEKVQIDLAIPAFHGENGEDGTIQGLFEIFNIPYTGCDVASSAMTIDKILTKLFYLGNNILTSKFVFFSGYDWNSEKVNIINRIKNELKWPMFVKPPKLGSSIGISKVKNEKELEFAVEVALHYGDKVLVEESVENLKDITCAVLGGDNPMASLIQESNFESGFLNYEDKYLKDGGTQTGKSEKSVIIPARLDEKTTKEAQELSVKIFKLFGCSGIARIDFLYDSKENKIYANEINTIPGTLYEHLWKASGVELGEIIKKIIDVAVERQHRKKDITHTFQSDLLAQTDSIKLSIKGKEL
ncbi:D-alanine--D-alanine ligase [Candidatus Wolfebacteria bacterium CG10_big_fil_rev_8_21_14_0_10_31_9]|uniref:D-alanine--D-alanine ligase n=1 Tax=Candidatus Wolfebacteria bacterium CG10_big_fil_rev_8_21_14_0_10_31_9 TaxID=1975070 RepID=A0A2H0RE86_9BACT|nr:MAG: D-alanine--D-alanine ligase [Candidatus Wolfebacteria bacterium CG10_big_fil_rev_8_21_14_0_10_31_9]